MTRMKIATLTTLALAMLVLTSVALASSQFKQTAKVTLTATKEGKPTGFNAALLSSDPGEAGGKPQALKTLTITLPSATKFNFKSKALALCKASDAEIKGTGGAVCPAKSKIGSGNAQANGAPVFPTIPESATAYAGNGNIIFLLSPTGPAGTVLVLHGVVSANKVTTSVPMISAGGLTIVITELNLKIGAVGSGKNAFITAGKCTSGKFKVKSNFLYYTGASLSIASSSKCSK